MPSCKNLTCIALVTEGDGYCQNCGGRERYERELEAMTKRESRGNNQQPQKKFVAERPKGQAVPHDAGLAQFSQETPEDRERRLTAERLNREKRDADREKLRQKRLDARPEKGKSGKTNQEGTGTSKKSQRKHRKNRKLGATGGRFK